MAISVGLPVAVNNSVPASQVGFQPRADPASEARGGAISAILGSQVS